MRDSRGDLPAEDEQPMLSQAANLLRHGSTEEDLVLRRKVFTKVQELALRSRVSLKRRGFLNAPATSPLREDAVASLNRGITDPDPVVREVATWVAGSLGDVSSADALNTRLNDENHRTRIAAIVSLSDIGGPAAATSLAGVVGDTDQPEKVRFAALSSLEELVGKELTSGPDRRGTTDPHDSTTHAFRGKAVTRGRSPSESSVASELTHALRTLGDEKNAPFWRLKGAEIIRYLSD